MASIPTHSFEGFLTGSQLRNMQQQRLLQQQSLGLQSENIQSEIESRRSQAAIAQQQANTQEQYRQMQEAQMQPVTVPPEISQQFGLPENYQMSRSGLAEVIKMMALNQGKKMVAEINQGAPVAVHPDVAQKIGLDKSGYPQNSDGSFMIPAGILNKATSAATKPLGQATTTQGVLSYNKLTGEKTKIGDAIQSGRLSLAQDTFDRDTFGQLFHRPGQPVIPSSLLDKQGNVIGWKSPSAPTSSTKQMAQQAGDLVTLMDKVTQSIDALDKKGKLGPIQGRINEAMVGRVGADDPDFAELRTLGSMVLTGAMRAHFGARGGQQMYDHFQALFDTGKMSAGDLKASLAGFRTFLDQYAQNVRTAGSKQADPLGIR